MALTQDELDQVYNYVMGKGQSLSGLPDGGTDLSSMYLAPLLKYSPGGAATLVRLAVSLLKGDSAYQVWVNEPGNAGKTLSDFFAFIKGAKGDPFTFADFTPEQLVDLALTYDKLTPEQKEEIKLKFADLTEADILALQKPATDAAAEMRQEMVQISQNANAAIEAANTAAGNAQDAADNVQDGKTPILESVNAQPGDTPSGDFTANGVDALGNPKYILNLTLPAGKDGQPAVFEQGTTTTVEPNGSASVEVVENGTTPEGNPKYILNFSIPRGQQGPPGAGSGNVSADGTGLVIGKKYLFVPDADDSTAGTFVEYVGPTKTSDLTNDSGYITKAVNDLANYYIKNEVYTQEEVRTLISNLNSVKLQKVESLPEAGESNIIYLVPKVASENDIYDEYIFIDGKPEHIGSTQVDLSNYVQEAPEDGKQYARKNGAWSEIETSNQYLDLTMFFDTNGTLSDENYQKIVNAYEKGYKYAINDSSVYNLTIQYAPGIWYSLNISSMTASEGVIGITSGLILVAEDKSYAVDASMINLEARGDGTKALMNDGIYKDNIASATKLQTARNINGVPFDGTKNISIGQLVPIMIEGGTDLNDFTTPGMYFNPSDAVTATIVNVPIAHAFSLLVEKHAGYKQTFTVYGDNFMQMFVRNYDGYSWSPWYKISLGTSTNISNLNVIPVGYDIVTCTLNTNTSITVENAGMAEYNGRTISVYVLCGTTARTITIPTTGNYISMCGSSYTCPANKWVEFNLTCVDGKWHIAKLEQE